MCCMSVILATGMVQQDGKFEADLENSSRLHIKEVWGAEDVAKEQSTPGFHTQYLQKKKGKKPYA